MIESNDLAFAKALKFLRQESGKIQFALALDLQLPNQQALSEYESGKKHFTPEFILKLCACFAISVDRFHQLATQLSKQSHLKIKPPSQQETDHEQQLQLLMLRKKNLELVLEKHRLECELYEIKIKLGWLEE